MRVALLLMAVSMVSLAEAAERPPISVIDVGGAKIKLPPPEGFSPVTADQEWIRVHEQTFVPPPNVELGLFLPSDTLAEAKAKGVPQFTRRISVQTTEQLAEMATSLEDFERFKQSMLQQVDKARRLTKLISPRLFEGFELFAAGKGPVPTELAEEEMFPLAVHWDSSRAAAFSNVIAMKRPNSGNAQTADASSTALVASTAVFTLLQDRLLFIYFYAELDGLAWSRDTSRTWVESLLKANAAR